MVIAKKSGGKRRGERRREKRETYFMLGGKGVCSRALAMTKHISSTDFQKFTTGSTNPAKSKVINLCFVVYILLSRLYNFHLHPATLFLPSPFSYQGKNTRKRNRK